MNEDVINGVIANKVKEKILSLCNFNESNTSTKMWPSHIKKVVDYSNLLAIKLEGDVEVCVLAAWLHDIAKIEGVKKNHHVLGAKRASEILEEFGYDKNKIKLVQDVILTH